MENKFYIADCGTLSDKKVEKFKQNNIFIINTLEYLMLNNGDVSKLDKDYRDTIVNRNLPTVANVNNCHAKLRFLVLALKNKENRKIFMESPIIKCLMQPLLAGYTTEEGKGDAWENYSNKANSTDEIANKSPFRGGLYVYRQSDRTFPIGLDFSKILDTIVKSDENGRYYISGEADEATKAELLQATQMQIDALKGSERFKNNFYHLDQIENEDDDENYDE